MRPDTESVNRAWDQSRRQVALRRALTANAPKRPTRIGQPALRSGASRWISAGVAVAAVSAAAFWLVPGSLGVKEIEAVPAATPTPPPAQTGDTVDSHPGATLAQVTVSTAGWKRFTSPEYPISFSYPPAWEVHFARYTPTTAKSSELTGAGIVDGCGVDGCTMYVSPPGQNVEGGHSVVLMRNGFLGDSAGGQYAGATVLATVPDLTVWTSPDAVSASSSAAIVTRSADGFCVSGCTPGKDFGPPYEYMLSTTRLASQVAVGEANPLAAQPEAAFSFGTNWGPKGDEAKTAATILASSRPNPAFNPTQPQKDSSGRYKFWVNDSMETPAVDTDVSTWKTLDIPDGNITVRVPPKWTVTEHHDGITWIKAPSGYIIDVLTNGKAEMTCRTTSHWTPSQKLSAPQGLSATDAGGTSRPIEIWWQDATWVPAQVWLTQVRSSDDNTICSQGFIDYGGKQPVYLGSADNSANPNPTELDQAVAILTSVTRQR